MHVPSVANSDPAAPPASEPHPGARPDSHPEAHPDAHADPWPPPDFRLIGQGRPDLPEFPLTALPPFWRGWVGDTACALGAPVDYVAQALLGAVAGLCGSGVVARLGQGWDEPLVLWLALVGGPATGKSAVLGTLRRVLAAVEKSLARGERGPLVVDVPTPPRTLLWLAAKRPTGGLLWRDESVRWLARLGRDGGGQPVDVSALLAAYSPLRTALGDGGPTLSMVGCLDPARLDEALAGSEDGRASRLLYAWPPRAPWRSFLERPALRESEAVNALLRIARAAGDGAAPLVLLPGEAALRVFDRHLATLHETLARCQGLEAAWLGNGRGTVARLAANLALLAWSAGCSSVAPPPVAISGDAMLGAVALWGYFRQHARAVFGCGPVSPVDHRVRQVVEWLRLARLPRISREDVRREALAQALDARQTLHVLERLQAAGCVRRVVPPRLGPGRPPLHWDVNPCLIAEPPAEIAQIAGIAQTAR